MNKLEKIIIKAEEILDYDNKDKLDKFMFKYGKWFIVIVLPIFADTLSFDKVPQDSFKIWVAIVVVFLITYLFCLFFCFVDVYRIFKKK